ncbi:polysaccharide biosynthesis tyrosine autokinase [Sphingomonas ginsenosidivorax]|uniref:non-specific protein-tyrosine kinase n=1 Tax=Sphingomonas ginsenosidivorax TaxID=862135 RepID=A0A5C6UGX0_9SPHN|nr:polysaccharide biosynthesis tyrosine autokinase [Sphingomonas ginsenosidivorax]TXC72007.1 polysaccharide biosynthesis tyrosine autokinase [Sphingomonas ginsenosidivorax]
MNVTAPLSGNKGFGLEPLAGLHTDAEQIPAFRHYLRIAIRRRFIILGAVVACMVLGVVITLLMTPRYTATTTVEISRDSDKVTDFQGVERETSVADQEFYQTQYGLLRARTLSERVADRLRLPDDPVFFERFHFTSNDPAFSVTNGRFAAGMRNARLRAASDILLKNLSVDPTRLSRLVDISFTSPDAGFSTNVVNTWADSFIHINLERKIQATSYGRNLLQQQLGQAKERLDGSQRQLVTYASEQQIINLPAQSNNGTTTAERPIVADDLAALNTVLTQATADRIQAEARYKQAGRGGASAEALRNQAINNLRQRRAELAADYQKLMTQFEPGYPAAKAIQSQVDQLDRSIAREEGRVTGSQFADYREAQEREQALQARVKQLKSNYLDLRRRSIQYNIYQQEVDTNRALYDGLLQRFKEIGVAGGVGINNISIVDNADVPQKPSSPRLLVNLAIALVAGLAIGILLAIALEQVDEAIADPVELERRLKLPLLGSVPKVANGEEPKDALLDRKSSLVDAYMAVQTNLGFTTEHGVPRSFAVTSTRPAEGKSTTALALATTLARSHRKVILVDGDMRSPSVHHLGGVDHDAGLSNFLAGEDNIGSLIFEMRDLGIAAMTAGPIPPNAAELLTGNRLAVLIERLLQTYDHVVIDSPPVMGLADAPLIAARVEGVVFAIEARGIQATSIKTALARLASANVRIFGGVLTKFEAQRGHYGYGYEYGYSYGHEQKTS